MSCVPCPELSRAVGKLLGVPSSSAHPRELAVAYSRGSLTGLGKHPKALAVAPDTVVPPYHAVMLALGARGLSVQIALPKWRR